MTVYELGELCTWARGFQVPRKDTSVEKDIAYLHYGDLYKLYDYRMNLKDELAEMIKIDNQSKIKPEHYLFDGDIVFALTSETVEDLGHCTLIVNPEKIPLVSGMETTAIHIYDKKKVNPSYLNYYFHTTIFQRKLQQYVTGMKVYRVHPKDLMKIEVDVPEKEIQDRVVQILDSIMDKIDLNSRINDNLMVLSGLIFQNWIRTFCKGECVSAIPNTDMQSLNHLCSKITDGSHFSPEAEGNGTHAMFSVKDMRTNRFDRLECKMIGDSAFEKLKSAGCVPIRDDIVIAKDGSYLKELFLINENHEDAILSSIAIFHPNSKTIYPEILLAYLRLPEVLATVKDNFVSGSAVPRIVLKSFKELQLCVPSLAKQEEILPCLRTIRDIIFKKELETIKLTQLRDYLLPKLIYGNVDCSCQTLLD